MLSIIEFGSSVRGGTDKYSDKDLLVVCSRRLHRRLRRRYEASGYSVSTLTHGQLLAMQSRGSLFVQHLKNESRILFDYQDCFRSWINSCKLVRPSANEIKACEESIVFFGSWPRDSRLDGWQADVLYCVVRDFLIKSLAVRSKLVFGVEDIEYALCETKIFPGFDSNLLRKFRAIKSEYRGGCMQMVSCKSIDFDIGRLVYGLGLSRRKNEIGSTESFLINLLARRFNSDYEKLRSLEAAYLIARSNGAHHPEHMSLMKFIRSPNAYGSSQVRGKSKLNSYFEDVITMLDNKMARSARA